MEIGIISPEIRDRFNDLMTPSVFSAFSGGAPISAIGLTDNSHPIGALAGMLGQGDIFNVLSLYVEPSHRRRGGGRMLIEGLQSVLEELKLPPAVLSYVEGEGESDTIEDFMKALGIDQDLGAEKLYYGQLGKFSEYGFGDDSGSVTQIKHIAELNKDQLGTLKNLARKAGSEMKGGMLTAFKPQKSISFAVVDDGLVTGFLMAGQAKMFPDDLVVRLSSDLSPDELSDLMDAFVSAAKDSFDLSTALRIPVPDTRYAYIFEKISGVRDIQHDYML